MERASRFKLTLLSATFLTGGLLAAPASAQDATAPAPAAGASDAPAAPTELASASADGDIVVTATRRSTSIQDTPINISALGEEALAREKIDDIRDIGAFTPGITVTDTGPRGAGSLVLRGLSASDSSVTGDNSNNSLGIYLGEVPLYADFKLIDLQRVETLLGPQGTLYGLGTLAGAIRYIPNRPDPSRFTGEVYARGYDVAHGHGLGYTGYAAVNVPIVKDAVAFRTVTGYYYDPGFIDYPFAVAQPGVSIPQPGPASNPLGTQAQQDANFDGRRDLNFEKTFTSRNQLGFTAEGFKAYVTYAYQRTKTDGRQANGGGVLGEGKYEGPWRFPEPADRKSQLLSLEVQADVMDFAQLVFTSAYTKKTNNSSTDVTDLLLDLDYGYEAFPSFAGYTDSRSRDSQYDNEIRLVSTHGGPFSWVIGGFWNRDKSSTNYREILPGFVNYATSPAGSAAFGGFYDGLNRPDNIEYISFTRSKTDEKAVFGEGTLHIIPQWQVTAGGRYFKYNTSITGGADTPLTPSGARRMPYPSTTIAASRIRSGDTADDGFVWKLNTSFDVTPDLLIYGTYSKGYRIGGVNRVAPCTFAPPPAAPPPGQNLCALPDELFYGPDKVKNAEIGIRASFLNRRISTNLSVFHIDWNGIQLDSQTVNGAIGITKNGGAAVSKGVDFSFNAKVTRRFSLRGNYSYLDAHLTEDVPSLLSIHGGDLVTAFAGDRLPGSAKNSGALSATYDMPIGDNSLSLNWTATYTGDIYSRPGLRGGGEKIPGYVMNRANITYTLQNNIELGVFANNIFDKYAVTGISNDLTRRGFVNDGIISRYYARAVAQPRTVGVEARYRF